MKLGGIEFFKDEPNSCQWTTIFQFFRYFLKWKQLFGIVETYFSIFFSWPVQTDFLPSGNSIFEECYFTASRNHYWNKEKTVLRERAHCCYWTTDFLANGNHFFLYFSETLFQRKYLFQRNLSFGLVETVLFCLEVFSSSENRHLNYWKLIFKERLCFN